MQTNFTTEMLEAYLDEALPAAQMTEIESALRSDEELSSQLAQVIGRRDAGLHSVGAIWRRNRLSCPTREGLGSYLLGAMVLEEAEHTRFHIETLGCRYCVANLEDLKAQQEATEADQIHVRRKKYFQSSAGYLSED